MVRLIKGQTQFIYLTLTEKQLLVSPNYLFIFTNRSNNSEVKFIKLNAEDLSLYKDRYNKFSITTNDYFSNKLNGQWVYNVYEQTSTTNINPSGLNLCESGVMELDGDVMQYTEYTTIDTYKIRQ